MGVVVLGFVVLVGVCSLGFVCWGLCVGVDWCWCWRCLRCRCVLSGAAPASSAPSSPDHRRRPSRSTIAHRLPAKPPNHPLLTTTPITNHHPSPLLITHHLVRRHAHVEGRRAAGRAALRREVAAQLAAVVGVAPVGEHLLKFEFLNFEMIVMQNGASRVRRRRLVGRLVPRRGGGGARCCNHGWRRRQLFDDGAGRKGSRHPPQTTPTQSPPLLLCNRTLKSGRKA